MVLKHLYIIRISTSNVCYTRLAEKKGFSTVNILNNISVLEKAHLSKQNVLGSAQK